MALKKLKWMKYLFINRIEAETEQGYWNEKRKRHLANEHSEGLVNGLEVNETSPPSLSVAVAAGRALDTQGDDPELESPQEIDCSALLPVSGEVTVYVTLRYNTIETDPYFVNEIGAYQNAFVQDSNLLEATTQAPSAPAIELARIRLAAAAMEITNAIDPANPGLNEIDLRQVKYSDKVVLALSDLSDVEANEAAAFNAMDNPSNSNPIATEGVVENAIVPVRDEVAAARGTMPSLDQRLDVMLENDGTFKGITALFPGLPLTGGGSVGNLSLGILDASQFLRGAMSATDKSKLDGIEGGATSDQTAAEILAAIKTVDGAGSGLDADLLDGSQHKGLGGNEHAVVSPLENGFMSAPDKVKLDGVEWGATADQSAAEILSAIKTVDGPGSGLDADTVDGKHLSEIVVPSAINHNSLGGLFGANSYYHLSSKQNSILSSGQWKSYHLGEDSGIQFIGSFRLYFILNTTAHFGTRTIRVHLEADGGENGALFSGGTLLADWDSDFAPNPAWIKDIYLTFNGIAQNDAPSWWAFRINWLQLVPSNLVSPFNLTGIQGDTSKQLSAHHWDLLINYTFQGPTGYTFWTSGPAYASGNIFLTYYRIPII